MRWITNRINRIAERWRALIHQYGPWFGLVVSLLLAWYFDSGKDLVLFHKFTAKSPARNAGVSVGYVLGYAGVGLYKSPERLLPMLAVLWSLAVLHYRYVFVRFMVNTGWRQKAAYGGVLLVLRWGLMTGITAWLGFADFSSGLVNGWLVYALLFAYAAHFGRLRTTRYQLTEQTTRAELDALKAQINPHFLFNSLNNIFGTALTENGPRTADSVQQLARILRYMLEQAHADRAPVGTELQFLDEYVLLQKQRLPDADAARVQFAYEWDEEPAQVAPLLLSPLLDYAFRRSTDAQNDGTGFLRANATVQARQLRFVLDYRCLNCQTDQSDELQNVRQRLALMYPNRHWFDLRHDNTTACLELTINLN